MLIKIDKYLYCLNLEKKTFICAPILFVGPTAQIQNYSKQYFFQTKYFTLESRFALSPCLHVPCYFMQPGNAKAKLRCRCQNTIFVIYVFIHISIFIIQIYNSGNYAISREIYLSKHNIYDLCFYLYIYIQNSYPSFRQLCNIKGNLFVKTQYL